MSEAASEDNYKASQSHAMKLDNVCLYVRIYTHVYKAVNVHRHVHILMYANVYKFPTEKHAHVVTHQQVQVDILYA
jgi:hypothetical protein